MSKRIACGLMILIAALMLADFIGRALVPAFRPEKTDFSELYASSWLWRHGANPYDVKGATEAQTRLVGCSVYLAPIYPLSTFVLVAPFTFITWGWANFLWLTFGLCGIFATIALLLRLRASTGWELGTAVLATFILTFDPLHQSFHLGNIALFVVPLSFLAIVLAEAHLDRSAGFLLGLATCLKPQLGIWILAYYLLRKRFRICGSAICVATAIAAALLLHPIPWVDTLRSYQANLHYWFAPGRPYGFTEGSLPFHVNITQVVIYQIVRNVLAANLIAYALFLAGITLWAVVLWRSGDRVPAPLAIASGLALSFLAVYHSVSDVPSLLLALCWAFPSTARPPWAMWTLWQRLACLIFLGLMLPGHSVLMRTTARIPLSLMSAWWWNLFVARYFVWLLLSLAIVLLVGVVVESRKCSSTLAGEPTPHIATSIAGVPALGEW